MKNFIRYMKNFIRYIFGKSIQGDYHPFTDSGLELHAHYNFENKTQAYIEGIFDYNLHWMTDEKPFHPDYLNIYYDKQFVKAWRYLQLYHKQALKTFYGVSIPFGAGIVRTKESYKYGYFEAEIRLPTFAWSWPAFWMYGPKTWPPEIDIVEAYGGKSGNFKKNWELQSNVHTGFNPEQHESIGGKSHPLPIDVSKEFVKYGVLWTETEIKFYYNRHLVRSLPTPQDLNVYPMQIIFGNGHVAGHNPGEGVMEIRNFKIYK